MAVQEWKNLPKKRRFEEDDLLMKRWLKTEEAKKVAEILKTQVKVLIGIWKSGFLNDFYVADVLNLSDASQTELRRLMNDKGKILTYEEIPFNMIGTFKNFECWDTDLIAACIEFKRKFDKWPTAFVANDCTYDKWEEVLQGKCKEPNSENNLNDSNLNKNNETKESLVIDWDSYDINIPLDEIEPERMPITWSDKFYTPLFALELIINNKYEVGMFRLMYGEGPGTDDGEDIPEETQEEYVKAA